MYHQLLLKHQWLNKTDKIVETTVTHPDLGSVVARVDLQRDSAEIIESEPTYHLSPADCTQILQSAKEWERHSARPYPTDIRWYEDDTVFDTWWESWEWVYSDIYNKIGGNLYDGYRTADEKMASALVYQLTELNTVEDPTMQVFARREFGSDRPYFRVWVKRIGDSQTV